MMPHTKWVVVVSWYNQENKEQKYASQPMEDAEARKLVAKYGLMGHEVKMIPERCALVGQMGGLYR